MSLVRTNHASGGELHREMVATTSGCDRCGKRRKTGKTLFRYYVQHGDGRREYHDGLFCRKTCHDRYHHQRSE